MTRRGFTALLAAGTLRAESQATFDFHSGLWVNLHNVLYNMAAGKKDGRQPGLSALKLEELAVWNDSLNYYDANVISHAFGEFPMIVISEELSAAGSAESLKTKDPDRIFQILEKAAPVYRAHWWPEHDRKNREWIDTVSPLVTAHEGALKPALARAYDTRWPRERVRVEVSYYLTGGSGYTSLEPTLTTVSSWSKRNAGAAGVETLFHEAGHAMMARVQKEIDSYKKHLPKDLWHALMFYTTGELVSRRLPEVEPYAIKYGLWESGWPGVLEVLKRRWKPFLDGQGTFREAIDAVVMES